MTGPLEILILLFVVFVILGPKRITSMFRALGRGLHDFSTEIGRKIDGKELPEDEENKPRRKD